MAHPARPAQEVLVRSMLGALRADIDRVTAAARRGDLAAVQDAAESARVELALGTSLLQPPPCRGS